MVIAKPFLSFGWRLRVRRGGLKSAWVNPCTSFHPSGPLWQDPHLWFLYLCQPTCLQRDRAVSRSEVLFKKLSKAKIAHFFSVRTQINRWSLSLSLSLFSICKVQLHLSSQMWSERAQLGVANYGPKMNCPLLLLNFLSQLPFQFIFHMWQF